ncbi:MAG TPA: hypothetical protein VIP57_02020 [Candidatus Dormibacteraeota bacterium]|jgi:hypothetical protein
MPYPTAAADLRDFYILAGTGAATLVGLLFVGLSLHLRTVIAATEVRSLARVTLANFAAVLFVSMFMVITEDRSEAALQLIGSGVVSLIVATPTLIAAARNEGSTIQMQLGDRARLVLRFGLSCAGYLGIVAGGALLLASFVSAFAGVIVVAIVVLLIVSLRNTWDLLVTVGEVTLGGGPDKD